MRRSLACAIALVALAASAGLAPAPPPDPAPKPGPSSVVTIPFELVNKHVYLPVRVSGSRPLSFAFDTGASVAMIDLDRAKELGLRLEGTVQVGGAGAQSRRGSWVRESTWTLTGLPGFSQPVAIAAPLANLAPYSGRDLDGILGGDFIAQYVVELDYAASVLRLHDREAFTYSGAGHSVPIQRLHGHPIVEAEVTPVGRAPIKGRFVVDVGAGSPLVLHSPFVAANQLPGPDVKTIRAIGGAGAGGAVRSRVGRVAQLKIGPFSLASPLALFSQDEAGAFASAAIDGNIGQPLLSRFKLFLDYKRERIIFEPTTALRAPFDRAFSGLALEAVGQDYTILRVREVLEESPASEAGIAVDDVITSIDGGAASQFTLSQVLEMFERPVARRLTIRRGGDSRQLVLTPRRLV